MEPGRARGGFHQPSLDRLHDDLARDRGPDDENVAGDHGDKCDPPALERSRVYSLASRLSPESPTIARLSMILAGTYWSLVEVVPRGFSSRPHGRARHRRFPRGLRLFGLEKGTAPCRCRNMFDSARLDSPRDAAGGCWHVPVAYLMLVRTNASALSGWS